MAELIRVPVGSASVERFQSVLEPDLWHQFSKAMPALAAALGNRVLWNINSTARGGGVAELLSALLPYLRGCGVDTRWLVLAGPPDFFALTKRLHNLLHGMSPGASPLTDAERTLYERTLDDNADALKRDMKPGDVVILHDPQTAGLVPALRRVQCRVIWRCHVGVDQPNAAVRQAWDFLQPYVQPAEATIFSRRAFVWDGLDDSRVHIIPPSIDPFTPKNQEIDDDSVAPILSAAGVLAGPGGRHEAEVRRSDGSPIRVTHAAEMTEVSSAPADARLVVQVARWDRLKDPLGVMQGFARHVAPHTDAHLVLAGPAASAIPDDPEGPAVLRSLEEAWQSLAPPARGRIHLAGLPMADLDENAIIVNALQRRAQVVVQKSIAEGFGLTVSEAMWKGRPVVAARVGGIQDQMEDGRSGLLIDDPYDLAAFGTAVTRLLRDRAFAGRLGTAAKQRVRREFLAPRQLTHEAQLVMSVIQA